MGVAQVVGDIALSSGTWIADVVLPDGTLVEQTGTTAELSRSGLGPDK